MRIQLLTIPGIRPIVLDEDVIATGFAERTDPAALVIGPTGVALGRDGTLYVADTQEQPDRGDPRRAVPLLPGPGGGSHGLVRRRLNGPLGMTLAPNGDILTANARRRQHRRDHAARRQSAMGADPSAGALFGLTVPPGVDGVSYVDDGTNTLNLLAP